MSPFGHEDLKGIRELISSVPLHKSVFAFFTKDILDGAWTLNDELLWDDKGQPLSPGPETGIQHLRHINKKSEITLYDLQNLIQYLNATTEMFFVMTRKRDERSTKSKTGYSRMVRIKREL